MQLFKQPLCILNVVKPFPSTTKVAGTVDAFADLYLPSQYLNLGIAVESEKVSAISTGQVTRTALFRCTYRHVFLDIYYPRLL